MERTYSLRFTTLIDLEPRLQSLLWDARQAGARCRNSSDFKLAISFVQNRLAGVVGFSSANCNHRILGSVGAYQVVYWKLLRTVAECVPAQKCPLTVERRIESRRADAAAALTVAVTEMHQGAIVRFEGSGDFLTAERMQAPLTQLCARRPSFAVLDLSQLTFLSSLAMGVLVRFRRDMSRWDGCVKIAGCRPEVYESMDCASLTDLFDFCTTVAEATTPAVSKTPHPGIPLPTPVSMYQGQSIAS
jgi:anti-anti-sigma factor